jgi:hypothetical protein
VKYHICNNRNCCNNREESEAPDIIYDIYFRCAGVSNGSQAEVKALMDILGPAWIVTPGGNP